MSATGSQHAHNRGRAAAASGAAQLWRFDAIEDRAVFQMLILGRGRRHYWARDERQFWEKYAPARDAFVLAIQLCLKWDRRPEALECLLYG